MLEKGRSKSYHLFEKESVLKKTLRNANNVSQQKIFQKKIKTSQIAQKEENLNLKLAIKDLRKDLLYIPHNFLEDLPKFSNSFVSFNDIHKKQPTIFPDLNYISILEVQEVEDKKKKEDNMSVIDKFLREMRKGSHRMSTMHFLNFREVSQILKELAHNESQKKLYDNAMDKSGLSSNEIIFEKFQKMHKK